MEDNQITMLMDVKLDLRDRKIELAHLKTWTKFYVKIEAVKCFPCLLRISFMKDKHDECTNLVVRINIPGLTVLKAMSRTKSHSYGLFWKNNRKRCCAFFALDSQINCERHMRWIKKSIRNLELYRQEVLQTRRSSRALLDEKISVTMDTTSNTEIYQNLEYTQNLKDLNDLLGPLPKVPDTLDGNWSRRVSGMSGIYEEIPDSIAQYRRNSKQISRASVASGIYEEMKPIDNDEKLLIKNEIPPPLPPRTRLNTYDGEIHRSFTNPESDVFKKKKYRAVFESVFGISKRSGSCSDTKTKKTPKSEKKAEKKQQETAKLYRNKTTQKRLFNHELLENKRNSFSSPDLSKIYEKSTDYLNAVEVESCCSEFQPFDPDCNFTSDHDSSFNSSSSSSNHISNLFSEELPQTFSDLNISEQIKSNFNISQINNISTINLIGSNVANSKFSLDKSSPIFDDLSGYCKMTAKGFEKPISSNNTNENIHFKFDKNELTEDNDSVYMIMNKIDNKKEIVDDTQYMVMKKIINDKTAIMPSQQTNQLKPSEYLINFRRNYEDLVLEYNPNGDVLYENLQSFEDSQVNKDIYIDMTKNVSTSIKMENIYENLIKSDDNDDDIIISNVHNEKSKSPSKEIVIDSKLKCRQRNSFDDKVPSYYPNDDIKLAQCNNCKINIKHLTNVTVKRSENLYISAPRKHTKSPITGNKVTNEKPDVKIKSPKHETKVQNLSNTNQTRSIENIYTTPKITIDISPSTDDLPINQLAKQITSTVESLQNDIEERNGSPTTPTRLYQKYSTLARLTPNRYLDKSAKKSDSCGKKFSSMPRLKKIDFSPLKLKINSVLQRHNSDI